jgi:hypothetical protein
MSRTLFASGLTGVFCAVFALVVSFVFDALPMWAGVLVAFCSGICGSLFAQLVLNRGKR